MFETSKFGFIEGLDFVHHISAPVAFANFSAKGTCCAKTSVQSMRPSSMFCEKEKRNSGTVDGRNPAPVDIVDRC